MATTTTTISTREFEREHGQAPRGGGAWAFCPADKYQRPDYLEFVFWVYGADTFTAAKKAARQHFANLSIAEVVVCS